MKDLEKRVSEYINYELLNFNNFKKEILNGKNYKDKVLNRLFLKRYAKKAQYEAAKLESYIS